MSCVGYLEVGHQRGGDGDQSGRELTKGEVAAVVAVADRAPSVGNTRPWKFRFGHGQLELLADTRRLRRDADPDGRGLMMSCGAALAGLRLGLRQLGLVPVVDVLPDRVQPWLIGRIRLAGQAAPTLAEAELIAARWSRPDRRAGYGPFHQGGEVRTRLEAALQADAAAEGCTLTPIADGSRRPGSAVLVTGADGAANWIQAGQALNRVLLRAAAGGNFAGLHWRPLESPDANADVRTRLNLDGYPQILLHLDRADIGRATARRRRAELVTNQ